MARYTRTKIEALKLAEKKTRKGEPFRRAKVIDIDAGRIVYRHATKGLRTRVMTMPLLNNLMQRTT